MSDICINFAAELDFMREGVKRVLMCKPDKPR